MVEINTYEQLRELDGDSDQLQNDAIGTICRVFDASPRDITHITVLKKGMTNRSFLFTCRGKQYIMRIPGEGTDRLIDRRQEAARLWGHPGPVPLRRCLLHRPGQRLQNHGFSGKCPGLRPGEPQRCPALRGLPAEIP